MWTLQSHKVDLKSYYNYWQFSTDRRLANMSASSLCLSFDSLAAGRFLEEAAVYFSRKKERNYSYVLSSPWIMLSFLETSNSSCQRWRVQ